MLFRSTLIALFALSWALLPIGASACSRPDSWTQQTIFDEAKEVFRARVTKVELSDYVETVGPAKGGRYLVHVSYELKEVLKGEPKPSGPISTTTLYFGGCGVPVIVGTDYIFFIDDFPDEVTEAARENSSGLISIFGTESLSPFEERAEEAMAKVRSYGARP